MGRVEEGPHTTPTTTEVICLTRTITMATIKYSSKQPQWLCHTESIISGLVGYPVMREP